MNHWQPIVKQYHTALPLQSLAIDSKADVTLFLVTTSQKTAKWIVYGYREDMPYELLECDKLSDAMIWFNRIAQSL